MKRSEEMRELLARLEGSGESLLGFEIAEGVAYAKLGLNNQTRCLKDVEIFRFVCSLSAHDDYAQVVAVRFGVVCPLSLGRGKGDRVEAVGGLAKAQ